MDGFVKYRELFKTFLGIKKKVVLYSLKSIAIVIPKFRSDTRSTLKLPDIIDCDWSEDKSTGQLRQQLEILGNTLLKQGNMHAFFLATYSISMKKCELLIDAIRYTEHPQHKQYADLDADLIEQIASHFSRLYFNAFHQYQQQITGTISSPWEIALRFSSDTASTPAQGIILGLIAHSCYDLPLVLSTKLDDGECLYNPLNRRHKQTYQQISKILTDELPDIVSNLERTRNLMNAATGKTVFCIFPWIYHQVGEYAFTRRVVYYLLNAVHREAALNSIRLQRGQITARELALVSNHRLNSVAGKFLPVKLVYSIVKTYFSNIRWGQLLHRGKWA